MSWSYRARKNEDKGEVWYDVVEYYTDGFHTKRGISPTGETKDNLIACLRDMIKDIQKYPEIVEENNG